MALTKCKECDHVVSTTAKTCPNCGSTDFLTDDMKEQHRDSGAKMPDHNAEHMTYDAMRNCLELISSFAQRNQNLFSQFKDMFSEYEARLTATMGLLESMEETSQKMAEGLPQLGSRKNNIPHSWRTSNKQQDAVEESISLYVEACRMNVNSYRSIKSDLHGLPSLMYDYDTMVIPLFIDTLLTVQAVSQTLMDTIAQIDESGITPELAEQLVQKIRSWDK